MIKNSKDKEAKLRNKFKIKQQIAAHILQYIQVHHLCQFKQIRKQRRHSRYFFPFTMNTYKIVLSLSIYLKLTCFIHFKQKSYYNLEKKISTILEIQHIVAKVTKSCLCR